jgi:hypothetical protein
MVAAQCASSQRSGRAIRFARAAERLWPRHRQEVLADPRNSSDLPAGWWLWDSNRADLFEPPTLDPRLEQYPAVMCEWREARAAVIAGHEDAWRLRRVDRQFDPTRQRREEARNRAG